MSGRPATPMSRDVAVAEYEGSQECICDALDEARFTNHKLDLPETLVQELIAWYRTTPGYETNLTDCMTFGLSAWPFDGTL